MKVLAFAGSNSSKSINHQLLGSIIKMFTRVEVELISLRNYEAPLYGIDIEETNGFPDNTIALKDKIIEADAYLISTAEHNSSMPVVLKNCIDWLSRIERKVFMNKPMILLSCSPGGRGAQTALKHLSEIIPHQGANLIGSYSVANFYDKVKDGELVNEEDESSIKNLMMQLEEELLS